MARTPAKPPETLPPLPIVTSDQQLTPTEIIEEGERQYRASGGNQPTFIDVNPQGKFSQATGGRVYRVEYNNFDEMALQDAVRKEAGPGIYVLTLRAAATGGHLARVPNFEVRGGPVAPAQTESVRSNPPASNQPGWGDIMMMMQAQNSNMIEVMKAFAGNNRGGGGGPSLIELMALMPKPTTLADQMTTLVSLQGLFGKMQKLSPAADGDGEGESGGETSNLLELGLKAFIAATEKKLMPTPAAIAPATAPALPPGKPPAPPPPPPAPAAAAPESPEDQAAALAWSAVGTLLTGYAGKSPEATAAAVDPFLGALKFDIELMGKPVRIDGWDALAQPDEVAKKVVEAFPALAGQNEWLRAVLTELVSINQEEE